MGGVGVVARAGGRGVALAERMAWADQIDREFDGMHAEMADMCSEMREMRGELAAIRRRWAVIGWGVVAWLILQLIVFLIMQA